MRRALLWLGLLLACAGQARAQPRGRGLIAPSSAEPIMIAQEGELRVTVRVATGLTPPPGVQTERALRGFGLRLCASEARVCTPVAVRNVRPLAAHSLAYRVEARLPVGLSPGMYDLELRFPGGSDQCTRCVRLEARAP